MQEKSNLIFDEDTLRQFREDDKVKEISEQQTEAEGVHSVLSKRQLRCLSEIQVQLEVDIGRLQMSAEELIDLVPGKIFEFHFDPNEAVLLRVGEECIASAKFVVRDDVLALEILSTDGSKEEKTDYSSV